MDGAIVKSGVKRQLVIATGNMGKAKEFQRLLKDFPIEIKGLGDFGPIPEVEEDGDTFEENAVKKARFTARVLGLPALADDSGLMVDALDRRPGVYSARYAGENAGDLKNNRKLLAEMEGVEDRRASFMCVIAIAVPRGPALIYEGKCEGVIAHEMKGEGGFGYDPLFYYPSMKKTFAQMTPDEKNSVSHRGRAMNELKDEFNKVMIWLSQRLAEEPF